MDIELILLLALLLGAGAAAASGPSEPVGEEETAPEPSFFQLPDFTLPEFPAFPEVSVTPQPAPRADVPYWFAEIERMYPGATIKVGPSS